VRQGESKAGQGRAGQGRELSAYVGVFDGVEERTIVVFLVLWVRAMWSVSYRQECPHKQLTGDQPIPRGGRVLYTTQANGFIRQVNGEQNSTCRPPDGSNGAAAAT